MKFLTSWESASTKNIRHLPAFIGLLVLVIGLTVALTLAVNSTKGGQSGASGNNCLPLPNCFKENKCPEIINYKIPNFKWCLPNPTPPVTGCHYQTVVCPAIACVKGQPCPTCPPPKLVCPPTTPTPTPGGGCYFAPVACPLYCVQGQPCPTCAPQLVCPSPSPKATPTPQFINCGSPNFTCPTGFTCSYCTGAIAPGQPTPKPNTGCVCVPNSNLTPIPPAQSTAK